MKGHEGCELCVMLPFYSPFFRRPGIWRWLMVPTNPQRKRNIFNPWIVIPEWLEDILRMIKTEEK
jgi:hypothetical protein